MNITAFAILCFLIFIVHSKPFGFLKKLGPQDFQTIPTLVHHLLELKTQTSEEQMELDILVDFIEKQVSSDNMNYHSILLQITRTFDRFKQRWIQNMIVNSMRAIGLDQDDIGLRNRIIKDPKAYGIDYQTYKIINFRGS